MSYTYESRQPVYCRRDDALFKRTVVSDQSVGQVIDQSVEGKWRGIRFRRWGILRLLRQPRIIAHPVWNGTAFAEACIGRDAMRSQRLGTGQFEKRPVVVYGSPGSVGQQLHYFKAWQMETIAENGFFF